jgi:hypothetical protein
LPDLFLDITKIEKKDVDNDQMGATSRNLKGKKEKKKEKKKKWNIIIVKTSSSLTMEFWGCVC